MRQAHFAFDEATGPPKGADRGGSLRFASLPRLNAGSIVARWPFGGTGAYYWLHHGYIGPLK